MKEIKVMIYLKGKDKPVVITDTYNPEQTLQDFLSTYIDLKNSEEGAAILEFKKDFIIVDPVDIQAITVEKPPIDNEELLLNEEDKTEKIDKAISSVSEDENVITDDTEEIIEEDKDVNDAFDSDDDIDVESVEIVEEKDEE